MSDDEVLDLWEAATLLGLERSHLLATTPSVIAEVFPSSVPGTDAEVLAEI